ncbi:MAG: hypothetical protein ACLRXQ_01900 [Phascolarctobacterium faecium]
MAVDAGYIAAGIFYDDVFTSIGYTASLRMLKEGGLSVLKLVAVCACAYRSAEPCYRTGLGF